MEELRERKGRSSSRLIVIVVLLVIVSLVTSSVVYVMIMGRTGSPCASPSGIWASMERMDAIHVNITFGRFTSDIIWTDIMLIITDGKNNWTVEFTSNEPVVRVTGNGLAVTPVRISDTAEIKSGDSLVLTFGFDTRGVTYYVDVWDLERNHSMSMVGNNSFTM